MHLEINEWLTSNRLKLNTDNTQFIWVGTGQQLAKVHCHTITLRDTTTNILTEVTCFGVVIDQEMNSLLTLNVYLGGVSTNYGSYARSDVS